MGRRTNFEDDRIMAYYAALHRNNPDVEAWKAALEADLRGHRCQDAWEAATAVAEAKEAERQVYRREQNRIRQRRYRATVARTSPELEYVTFPVSLSKGLVERLDAESLEYARKSGSSLPVSFWRSTVIAMHLSNLPELPNGAASSDLNALGGGAD